MIISFIYLRNNCEKLSYLSKRLLKVWDKHVIQVSILDTYAIAAVNPEKIIRERDKELSYSPVDLCSPIEAWLGKSKNISHT